MLTITTTHPSDLDAVGERWRALEQRSDCSFFQSWAWTGCLAADRFRDPVLIEVRRRDECVAMALFNRRRARWPHMDRLWLGESGTPALDSVFIEHNGPLIARGEEDALRDCLQAVPRSGRRVVFSGVGAAELRVLETLPGAIIARQTRVAPYIDLAAIRDAGGAYLDSLSANTRYQLRRSARRYAASGPLRVERAGSPAEAHSFLDRLAVLHQATWTKRGRPGAFANPDFARFHHTIIDRTAGSGAADLLQVMAGPRVVGYLYNFRFQGAVSAYQSGFAYDDGDSHAKPGLTCHHLAAETYLAEGADRYDFLAGDDRYKASLSNAAASLHWIELAPAWSAPDILHRLAGRWRARTRPADPAQGGR
jgi:CelD/BcsL family acetyltransferase involved in cellulose biosynthesis